MSNDIAFEMAVSSVRVGVASRPHRVTKQSPRPAGPEELAMLFERRHGGLVTASFLLKYGWDG